MDLAQLLTLAPTETDAFRSVDVAGGATRVFGGQVVAQALMAALGTVPADRPAHSLHAHFLRAGNSDAVIDYAVERLRDGKSFSTRHVTATQNGRKLLIATVSCHEPEEGLAHQFPMPDAPPPEGLRSEHEIRKEAAARTDVEFFGPVVLGAMKAELRPVWPRNFVSPEKRPPRQDFWVRPIDPVPDDAHVRQAAIAYISDMMLLSTALLPHGVYWTTTAMDSASLDHAVWFHRPPSFADWMLWTIETPWTGAARGLARGALYDRDGTLVASVAQEGLMRLR